MDIANRISPVLFALAAICFFMPFFQVSCEGRPVGEVTGLQLATGVRAEAMLVDGPGPRSPSKVSVPEPLAVAALTCALAGVASGIPVLRRSGGRLAIVATIGMLAWFWLKPALAESEPPEAAFRAEAIHIGIVLGVMSAGLIVGRLAGAGKRFAPQVVLAALGVTLLVWLIAQANLDWIGGLFRETSSMGSGRAGPVPPITIDVRLGIIAAIVLFAGSGILHAVRPGGSHNPSEQEGVPACS